MQFLKTYVYILKAFLTLCVLLIYKVQKILIVSYKNKKKIRNEIYICDKLNKLLP